MEFLGEQPVWSMSGSEMLTTLDAVHAEVARLKTYSLHLMASLDATGHAKDLGAGDTARLLSMRYRLEPADVRRDLRLATTLPKYQTVSAALPDPAGDDGASDHPTGDDGAGDGGAGDGEGSVLIHPAQADAIVAALEKVPTTVPVEELDVAEQQLVNLAAHLTPSELRTAGKRIRDLLDTDGPEPDEQKAYGRESLSLTNADNGVKFRGYLANENAELLKTLIHAGAKPHKTVDGELDPRPRDKRQADALSAILATAAAASDTPGTIPGHGPKANITVTINLDDLKSETADAIGDLVFGDGLSAAAVRRLACDAKVIPVVLGSKSQPLDVGMAERLVTGPMRSALNARDRGLRRLRRATHPVRGPPPDPLDRRRPDRRHQPRAAVQTPPHRPPRRPLDHPDHRRRRQCGPPQLGRPRTRPTPQVSTTRQHRRWSTHRSLATGQQWRWFTHPRLATRQRHALDHRGGSRTPQPLGRHRQHHLTRHPDRPPPPTIPGTRRRPPIPGPVTDHRPPLGCTHVRRPPRPAAPH